MKNSKTIVILSVIFAVVTSLTIVSCSNIFSEESKKDQVTTTKSILDYVKSSKVTAYDQKEVKFTDNVSKVTVIDGSTVPPIVIKNVTLDENRTISMRVINQSVILYDASGNEIISSEVPLYIAAK
ncbi:MAG: hypothetical protein NTY12_01700 [Candidatus Falkowbacteria bacterium]|nr:hypothetical protein [Candidatus Falkowbacteria bacterium]